ncbi:thermonuclease family protein [Propylenella binzhouense]|uniref:TNase-like domain-containing protein n=1 Tax=Propylenella binzhouense TaxID=2555902 RepID=A0A964T5B2_9HYPH|nr:hypothetical protein [Propylenella binzhouense]MYZ48654.1 hypothetical protein [Propylenella binzhouense]
MLGALPDAPATAFDCTQGREQGIGIAAPDARTIRLSDGRLLSLASVEPFSILAPGIADAETRAALRLAELARGPLTFTPVSGRPDRYGRLPSLVFGPGGLLQAELAEAGLAIGVPTSEDPPCLALVTAAEERARKGGAGFWGEAPGGSLVSGTWNMPGGRSDFVIAEGRVESVGIRPRRTYLNLGGSWSKDLAIVIESAQRERFGTDSEINALVGRFVRVRGFLDGDDRPRLAVRSPLQIEIIDGSERQTR